MKMNFRVTRVDLDKVNSVIFKTKLGDFVLCVGESDKWRLASLNWKLDKDVIPVGEIMGAFPISFKLSEWVQMLHTGIDVEYDECGTFESGHYSLSLRKFCNSHDYGITKTVMFKPEFDGETYNEVPLIVFEYGNSKVLNYPDFVGVGKLPSFHKILRIDKFADRGLIGIEY